MEKKIRRMDNYQATMFIEAYKKFIPDSVDLFLALNLEFTEIGKTAIYLSIPEYENKDKDINKIINWYNILFTVMVEGISSPNEYKKFSENEIIFITFNYDRSLEHFLFTNFLDISKQISESDKIEAIKKIKIFHVYGKLADLFWQNAENKVLNYGSEVWVQHY